VRVLGVVFCVDGAIRLHRSCIFGSTLALLDVINMDTGVLLMGWAFSAASTPSSDVLARSLGMAWPGVLAVKGSAVDV
jgi:hypothetical protein